MNMCPHCKVEASKLDMLAQWFDSMFPNDKNPEIQNDLRAWANNIRNMITPKKPKNKIFTWKNRE